jgi:hypothetical protein
MSGKNFAFQGKVGYVRKIFSILGKNWRPPPFSTFRSAHAVEMATGIQHINQKFHHLPPYLFNLLFERQHI